MEYDNPLFMFCNYSFPAVCDTCGEKELVCKARDPWMMVFHGDSVYGLWCHKCLMAAVEEIFELGSGCAFQEASVKEMNMRKLL